MVSSCGIKEASVLRGTLKEIYFPLTFLSDAVSSAVWENRALAGASEPRSDSGVDDSRPPGIILWESASEGHRTREVTSRRAELTCEHHSNQHSPAALQLVKHTHVTHSEHPEVCKITTLVPRVDYRAGGKLLSINSGSKDTVRSRG